jgi:uncharacterized membrane protein YgcG
VRYLLRLLAVATLLLLLAAPALAQGRFTIRDEVNRLDDGQIERAARELIDAGAEIAVYFVSEGSDADFRARLEDDGFVSGDLARTNLLGIYVGLDNRYSSIRYGDGFNEALRTNDNSEAIRNNVLNPRLSDGDFTQAVIDTLAAVDNAVQNPPVPGGGSITNVDTTPIVIGGVSVLAVAAGGVALAQRRRANKILSEAKGRFDKAKENAGTAIANLGQAFRKADEQAQFDKVSYAPAEVEKLARGQQAAKEQFVKVQTNFDDVGEEMNRVEKLDVKVYDYYGGAYQRVANEAAQVQQALDGIAARRAELDTLAKQAPGEIDRAKKS